jgi:hypothetical protein
MSKKCHCEEGLAEWVMSYADMITILMAFFVVMYSMAGDRNENPKVDAVMGSLRHWLGPKREHWPATWLTPKLRLPTAFDAPAASDNEPAATDNTQSTVPKPNASFPDGVTVYLAATPERRGAEPFNRETREQLRRIAETVAGKLNVIEIRGQAKRHLQRQLGGSQNPADVVYQECRLVMAYLVEQGIDARRIQFRIVRPESGNDDAKLAAMHRDIQIDIFMLNEMLELQSGIQTTDSGILKSSR